MLYFRTLLLIGVNLYTSRVVLQALGVDDFGIYNAVGGIVALFSVISTSLSGAISRFITFELGTGDMNRLKRVFSSGLIIQAGFVIIVAVLAETIGLWFLNSQMSIPDSRMTAANWVFHFSILTFGVNMISIPYNALIIAHERMSAFAYISILEAVFKLLIAFLIAFSPSDRLIFYAVLLFLAAFAVRMVYGIYCRRRFEESKFVWTFDRSLIFKMFGFAGWNLIGTSSGIFRDQGGNILLNIFYGPVVNAAKGITNQINVAIYSFVQNFMTAMTPQITKSYAAQEMGYMTTLVFQGARFSFYLLLILSLPVFASTPYILSVWLGAVPPYTVSFTRLTLLFLMIECVSFPLMTAITATGNIRNYQIFVGGLQLMNVPVSYVCLKAGLPPESVFVTAIALSGVCLVVRLVMLRRMIGFPALRFLRKVCLNILYVFLAATPLPLLVAAAVDDSLLSFAGISLLSLVCSGLAIYFVGCSRGEQAMFKSKLHTIIKRMHS